jgi:hypothetical protein
MNPDKAAFIVLNLVGGGAVLGSYALWLANPANDGSALWGSISGATRSLYTVSMFTAAAGYFAFAGYLLEGDAHELSSSWRLTLFSLILFPSALWMPLAFEYLHAPSPALWWSMRTTLAVVGIASLLVLIALLGARSGGTAHALAVVGAAALTFQTLVLDALVWPLRFPH